MVCTSCKRLYTCVFRNNKTFLVYNSMGYMDVVANAAEVSMNLAVHEIKDLPGYSDNGEVSLMYM